MKHREQNCPRLGSWTLQKFQGLETCGAGLSKAWTISNAIVSSLGIMLLTIAGPLDSAGAAENSKISTLEGLVGRLSELKLQTATEKREWREQKPHLKSEIELLKREKQNLEEELKDYRSEQSGLAEERAELIEKRERLTAAMDRLAGLVRRAEIDLKKIQPTVPKTLLGEQGRLFEKLPSNDAAAKEMTITRRLQRVLSLYTKIHKLQHEIHSIRTLVPLENGRREMDTLYIGLSQAFAVSADGQIGAVGAAAEAGWQWQRRDAIAPAIRKAITVYKREEPASLVTLPLEIEEGGAE